MKKYLAIDEDGEVYLEDSTAAIDFALVNNLDISYYALVVDEHNEPTLERITEAFFSELER